MKKKPREFTKEFKQEAVSLVLSTGKPSSQVAKELGIGKSSLTEWVRTSKQSTSPLQDVGKETTESENLRLRKEIERLKKEAEILKKAVAFMGRDLI